VTVPAVSVIVPTFNRGALLGQTLESLRAQTHRDFEVIVVDDGSTDNTRDVVQSFDQRFRYVHQSNRGRSNARNNALGLAQGRYIAFLDSDDLFMPDKLEIQVRCLEEREDVGWVYSSTRNIDEQGKPTGYGYEASASGWIHAEVTFFLPLTVILSTVMVRRQVMEAVGGFDENMNRFEDTDMWRRISRKYKALAIPEPLIDFREHSGNTMEDPRTVFESVCYYVDKIRRDDEDVDPSGLRNGASALFLHYGRAVYAQKQWRPLARPFLRASLRYRRSQVQAAEVLLATYAGNWLLGLDGLARRAVRRIPRRRGRSA
jgi:hypothetical protein